MKNAKIRKPFLYALACVILAWTIIFYTPWRTLNSIYTESFIAVHLRKKAAVQDAAKHAKDPLHKRILLEDPEDVANEQAHAGNFTLVGIEDKGTFAPTYEKYLVGVECRENENFSIGMTLAGCSRNAEYEAAVTARYAAYNRAVVTSLKYKGSCKVTAARHK